MSSSDAKIILYDLLCATPNTCWSPACWKTRLVLQHKHLPFKTVWVSYPDIKSVVGHTQPGADPVTLPVIRHGETWVADSWEIFLYLEKHFPAASDGQGPGTGPGRGETLPSLIYPNIDAVYFFENWTHAGPIESVIRVIVPQTAQFLDDRGREFFVRTREASFGMPLEEVGKGEGIEQIEVALEPVVFGLKRYGPYLGGKQMSYQDLILLATLLWFEKCVPGCVNKIMNLYPGGHFQRWYDRMLPLAVTQCN